MEKYSYYIAYCFKSEDDFDYGYGNLIITNSKQLVMETPEDIKEVEDYIKEIYKRENKKISNIVVMDFRKLNKGE